MSDAKTPLQTILSNKASIHYQRRYRVFHLSAAAYIAIAWFLVIVIGMGRALSRT